MQEDQGALTVGQFAKLTGLTAHALRHYDEVRLLQPSAVDEDTGYRWYSREQLATARLIKDLRWLDLPISQVRDVIAGLPTRSPRRHSSRSVNTPIDSVANLVIWQGNWSKLPATQPKESTCPPSRRT